MDPSTDSNPIGRVTSYLFPYELKIKPVKINVNVKTNDDK